MSYIAPLARGNITLINSLNIDYMNSAIVRKCGILTIF